MPHRDKLRSFHLTGEGLEDWIPAEGWLPCGVETLPPLEKHFPLTVEGVTIPFAAHRLPTVYEALWNAVRKDAVQTVRERVREWHRKLIDLLAADDCRAEEQSPEELNAAMGGQGGNYLNAVALSQAFHHAGRGPLRMSTQRRARIEQAASSLRRYMDEQETCRVRWQDNVAAAMRFVEGMLAAWKPALQAMRVARLEVDGAYVPELHDDAIARVDWEAADADELAALPAVVVMEPAARLAQTSLTDFGAALRSRLPIQILVTDEDGLYGPEIGQTAMAYRQTFVLQGSLSQPDHLVQSLREMTRVLTPAVAVISVPGADGEEHIRWMQLCLLHRTRAFPLFRYDPGRGEHWADRFAMECGEPGETWTPAHAALTPYNRRHFRLIPESAWSEDQLEITEYLARYKDGPPRAVPFVWVENGASKKQRAILTRELAYQTRETERSYRLLAELARARPAASSPEDGAMERAHREGAQRAIGRLVAVLTNATAAIPAPEPHVAATPLPPSRQEISAAPYIDSSLCTSCNDCMKVNAKLFLYNGDKQAYLGDLTSGTFADLVKAAEGCPAKCIHPGAPRPGDATATPAVVARGARFP